MKRAADHAARRADGQETGQCKPKFIADPFGCGWRATGAVSVPRGTVALMIFLLERLEPNHSLIGDLKAMLAAAPRQPEAIHALSNETTAAAQGQQAEALMVNIHRAYLIDITTADWSFNVQLYPEMKINTTGDPTCEQVMKEYDLLRETDNE